DSNSTSGCFTSASPAVSPNPCTTLKTPLGSSASRMTLANKLADSGDNSAGFKTTVFPVAKAGATFHVSNINGDRKSTRLNSSHVSISYAVFCLKKKTRRQKNIEVSTIRDKKNSVSND